MREDVAVKSKARMDPTGCFRYRMYGMCSLTLQLKDYKPRYWWNSIKLKSFTNRKSRYEIFILICPCELIQIGSTTCTVKIRILEHKSRIKNGVLDASLVPHFREEGHSADDLKYFVLLTLKYNSDGNIDMHKRLLQLESLWIFKLNTVEQFGLNQCMDLSCYL